jgi:rhodanese-related sulfurtransferase
MLTNAIVPVIDADTAASLGNVAVLLDVREDEEWYYGHAPGALHIAMSRLPEHLDALDRTRRIICICRSGNRSARVTRWLRELILSGLWCFARDHFGRPAPRVGLGLAR